MSNGAFHCLWQASKQASTQKYFCSTGRRSRWRQQHQLLLKLLELLIQLLAKFDVVIAERRTRRWRPSCSGFFSESFLSFFVQPPAGRPAGRRGLKPFYFPRRARVSILDLLYVMIDWSFSVAGRAGRPAAPRQVFWMVRTLSTRAGQSIDHHHRWHIIMWCFSLVSSWA